MWRQEADAVMSSSLTFPSYILGGPNFSVNPERTVSASLAAILDLPVCPTVLRLHMSTIAYNVYMGARDPNLPNNHFTHGSISITHIWSFVLFCFLRASFQNFLKLDSYCEWESQLCLRVSALIGSPYSGRRPHIQELWAAKVVPDGFKNKRTEGGKGGDLGGVGEREWLWSKYIYEILKKLIKGKILNYCKCRGDMQQ